MPSNEFKYAPPSFVSKNGTMSICDEKMIHSQNELADVAFPEDLDEINQDRQFFTQYINKEEFESLWNKRNKIQ